MPKEHQLFENFFSTSSLTVPKNLEMFVKNSWVFLCLFDGKYSGATLKSFSKFKAM